MGVITVRLGTITTSCLVAYFAIEDYVVSLFKFVFKPVKFVFNVLRRVERSSELP